MDKRKALSSVREILWETAIIAVLIISLALLNGLSILLSKLGLLPDLDKKIFHYIHLCGLVCYMATLAFRTILRLWQDEIDT